MTSKLKGRERLTSDSAAHLLSFTFRWGSVPARVQIAFSRYGNTEQEET